MFWVYFRALHGDVMKASLSEGMQSLYTREFMNEGEFEFFIENVHNIVNQFVCLGGVKYTVRFERVGGSDGNAA